MDRTNQEIWDEVLRTAQLLRESECSLRQMERVAAGGSGPLDVSILPIGYVSDAMALTMLLLELKRRGVTVA